MVSTASEPVRFIKDNFSVQLQEPRHQQASRWQTQWQEACTERGPCHSGSRHDGSTALTISVEDIAAVKALADRIGAEKVQAQAKVLA
jgi:type IV secretory pathway TrbF-like protein